MKPQKLHLAKETLVRLSDQQSQTLVGGIRSWIWPNSGQMCAEGSIFWNCTYTYPTSHVEGQ